MSNQSEPLGRHGTRSISRRRFLYGAAAGVGGLALSSCSPSVGLIGSSKPTVTFWNLFGGGDGARLGEMESTFRKNHPDLGLKSITFTWGPPYYTKLAMAIAGGSPPDTAVMHLSRMGGFAPAGLLEPLHPDELSQYDIGPDKFLPEVLDSAKYKGEIYAIPLDTHPFVQYYNLDVLKKADLLGSDGNFKPLNGPDEAIRAFKKAKEATGAWGLSLSVANDPSSNWRLFYSLYSQMGGKILSPDAKKVVIDEEKALRALKFMTDLTLDAKVAPNNLDYPGSVATFQSGRAGFYWNGEWEIPTFQDAKMNFNVVPFPNLFGGNQAQADRHSFVIPKGVDPESKKRALEFISSMLKNSLTWAEGGHIPAYQSVVESKKYKNLKPQSNYADAAKYAVLDPIAWFSGAGSQLEIQAGVFQSVMSGSLAPKQALDQFRSNLQRLVNTPKPF